MTEPFTHITSNLATFKPNNHPEVTLVSPDGAKAEIFLQGAHTTSWIPAGDHEKLFLSKTSDFGPETSIRGGVPVIFPQFCSEGPLIKHGFARRMDWSLLKIKKGGTKTTAIFQLNDNDTTHQIWPYPFLANLNVTIGGKQLEIVLNITNTGMNPFSFSGALHTYFRVDNIYDTFLKGLKGISYFDSIDRQTMQFQQEKDLYIKSQIDRFYINAPKKVTLCEKTKSLDIEMKGFQDIVVWNPWIEQGESIDDLEPEGYKHMLCVEAAIIDCPVKLAPGETWTGFQRLIDQKSN
jgi:glucose-6-phosphate 1-epimerase